MFEVFEDEATLVPAAVETDALADALTAALASSEAPEARARRRALAAGFSWERCARETQALWKCILARGD